MSQQKTKYDVEYGYPCRLYCAHVSFSIILPRGFASDVFQMQSSHKKWSNLTCFRNVQWKEPINCSVVSLPVNLVLCAVCNFSSGFSSFYWFLSLFLFIFLSSYLIFFLYLSFYKYFFLGYQDLFQFRTCTKLSLSNLTFASLIKTWF